MLLSDIDVIYLEEHTNKKIKKIGFVLLAAGLSVLLYIFLHESGHMIVMLSAGATITDFSILTAHVSAINGNYTNISDLWLNANGAVLPVLVSLTYTLLYKKNSRKSFYNIFSYMFALIPTASMLAWVIIPFAYLQRNAPANDDVTKFLYNFSQDYHPLIVSAIAAAIIGISIVIIIKKQVLRNYFKEFGKPKDQIK